MKSFLPSFCCAALLSLGACASEPPEPETEGTDAPIVESASAGADAAGTEMPGGVSSETAVLEIANDEIPKGMHGRWGLVAADCTSTRGDAKGLMTVGSGSLKFYESVAELDGVKKVDADTLSGRFDFSGEGQTWTLQVTLDMSEDRQTLVRRDSGPDAMPEPLTYTRCAA